MRSALDGGWLTTEAVSGLAKLLLYRNFLFNAYLANTNPSCVPEELNLILLGDVQFIDPLFLRAKYFNRCATFF